MSVMIVGELNPFGGSPGMALYHLPRQSSGNRLRIIMGLTDVSYSKLMKVNLCYGRWSMPEARKRARALLETYPCTVSILLGRKVIKAFEGPPFFQSTLTEVVTKDKVEGNHYHRDVRLISLPHPSGLNRIWHDPMSRERALHLLQTWVTPEVVPFGEMHEPLFG